MGNALISIIIPCRNEERRIQACLDGVLAFERPEGVEYEILVLDGMSTDATRQIVRAVAGRHPSVRLLDNPKITHGCAVNIAVRSSNADYFLWLGAHTEFPRDYARLAYETAKRTGAHVVGGTCVTLPGGDGYGALLVQALTTHRFGVGNSDFRVGGTEGPVDTVPYPLFKAELFRRIGMLDERLVRAQDYEFNRRVGMAGGKIWMNPAIFCNYHNQPSLGAFYRKQIIMEAPYNAYMWYLAPYAFAVRHAVTAVFAAGVIAGACVAPLTPWLAIPYSGVMGLYFFLALLSAFQQAFKYRKAGHVVLLPVCFFLYHFLHGVGVLWGLLTLLLGVSPVQRLKEPWDAAGRSRAWTGEKIS